MAQTLCDDGQIMVTLSLTSDHLLTMTLRSQYGLTNSPDGVKVQFSLSLRTD